MDVDEGQARRCWRQRLSTLRLRGHSPYVITHDRGGPPSVHQIDEIYRAHKEGRECGHCKQRCRVWLKSPMAGEEDAQRMRGLSPEFTRESNEVRRSTPSRQPRHSVQLQLPALGRKG